MGVFSNREIATAVWLGIAGILLRQVSTPLLSLIGYSLAKPFVARNLAYMAGFSALCVWGLHSIGVWRLENLKTTVLWFVGLSLKWATDFQRLEHDPNDVARHELLQTAGITAVAVFVTSQYTLPLWGEMTLVPTIGILAFLAWPAPKREPSSVTRGAATVLGLVGLSLLSWSLFEIARQPRLFFTANTGREFLVPLILSICLTGFTYIFNVRLAYHLAFIVMGGDLDERPELRRYAKRLALQEFGPNIGMLRRWKAYILRSEVRSKANLLDAVSAVKAARVRERRPPIVAAERGWSPYAAMEFLTPVGLRATNYSLAWLGQWRASAPYKWRGDEFIGSRLEYDVLGSDTAATKIELTLDVPDINDHVSNQTARKEFDRAASLLLERTFGDRACRVGLRLRSNKRHRTTVGRLTASLKTEDGLAHRSEVTLAITHCSHFDPLLGVGHRARLPTRSGDASAGSAQPAPRPSYADSANAALRPRTANGRGSISERVVSS